MQEVGKKQKPFLVRILLALFLAIVFFIIGYSVLYIHAIEQFLSSTTKQISIKHTVQQSISLQNQVNILLLGSDNDQKFTGNPLTQTMMVVHIDFQKKEITMFSIPRDLWVRMPGSQNYGKIDQAAEYTGIPSAIQVVEQTFGIHVDHYAWVGLYGFIKSINAIGGINLQVIHPVLDNSYPTDINSSNPYGYQRLDIQPGMQHMSGEEALQYVRSRHEDLIGDFGRTERQRQLLLAVKDLLLHSQTSFLKIPSILQSLNGQVTTDISAAYGLQLGFSFLSGHMTIKQITLTPPLYSSVGNSTDGQSIVIGNASNSAKLLSPIFGEQVGETTLNSLSTVQGVAQ